MPKHAADMGTQSRSEDHWVPGILEDCDIQFGVYFSDPTRNNNYDVYCFACGKWVIKNCNSDSIGFAIENHEMEPHLE